MVKTILAVVLLSSGTGYTNNVIQVESLEQCHEVSKNYITWAKKMDLTLTWGKSTSYACTNLDGEALTKRIFWKP